MNIQIEKTKAKSKPDGVSIQVGAAIFSCPMDWDDPDDIMRVWNHSLELVETPLRNEINRLLRELAELKSDQSNAT